MVKEIDIPRKLHRHQVLEYEIIHTDRVSKSRNWMSIIYWSIGTMRHGLLVITTTSYFQLFLIAGSGFGLYSILCFPAEGKRCI